MNTTSMLKSFCDAVEQRNVVLVAERAIDCNGFVAVLGQALDDRLAGTRETVDQVSHRG